MLESPVPGTFSGREEEINNLWIVSYDGGKWMSNTVLRSPVARGRACERRKGEVFAQRLCCPSTYIQFGHQCLIMGRNKALL